MVAQAGALGTGSCQDVPLPFCSSYLSITIISLGGARPSTGPLQSGALGTGMRSEFTREVVSGGSDIQVLSKGGSRWVLATVLEGSRAGLDGRGPGGGLVGTGGPQQG